MTEPIIETIINCIIYFLNATRTSYVKTIWDHLLTIHAQIKGAIKILGALEIKQH